MRKYCHKRKFQVLYSDCDCYDVLRPAALLGYVQDAAGSSAEELHFGYDDLIAKGYGFLTVATCCEIYSPIRAKDEITISTWPIVPRHVFCERDYAVKNSAGKLLAAVSSRWCLYDLNEKKLVTPDKTAALKNCPYRSDRVMQPDYRTEKLGDGESEVYRLTARPSHCDHYHHVNNTRYLDFFMDCFSSEELKGKRVCAFRVSYARQVREGETLALYRRDSDGGVFLEARENGEATTRFFVQFCGENE